MQVRSFNVSNGTSQNVTYPLFSYVNPDKSTLSDVNGDGMLDFVSLWETGFQIRLLPI
ncbi:hypothetical protein LEP1GSC088_0957 [Leptospira interrogans str. L1207]|nr:hypothetical protein LEP1GSC088_0957 [Leptospira interrogans str. L1207]